MIITSMESSQSANHGIQTATEKLPATGTPEAHGKLRASLQDSGTLKFVSTLVLLATVYYKPNKSRTTQMTKHITVCHEENKWLAQNWRNQIRLPEKFKEFHRRVFSMLSEFKFK